jgi:hypothetical protein
MRGYLKKLADGQQKLTGQPGALQMPQLTLIVSPAKNAQAVIIMLPVQP